jgi:GH15 family glucan-1,4-alpha-glucosidase
MRVSQSVTGNPWFICTLWLADYRIAVARKKAHLKGALEILEWTCQRALPSGVLAEQVHPETGAPISVSPLTWSHSTFVATVQNYLKKLREFE